MSAKEKHVAQIFERTKRIIDQAWQQCHFWEHHLSPKLILNGILPPPWLCNSPLHSLPSNHIELNKDAPVSEVIYSQTQFAVPFSGRHCSLYSNLGVVSDDVQYPIDFHNEGPASRKDCHAGDGLSNLPECSVNNDGCASSGPPELDSGAPISPQNQIEHRVSESYHDPALLSRAKLQRSKSRQRALELRKSAKALKHWSGNDNNAGVCAGTVTGSVCPTLQADHMEDQDLVKEFHPNIQSCSMEEEVRRGDCMTQNYDKSNHSGRIRRSKSLAQKFNSLNAASSSVVEEDGPPCNNSNEPSELVSRPCFTNGSFGVKEANKGEYQKKEAGSGAYHKGLTKSRSTNQARYNSELLKLDSTSGRGKGVEAHDFMQPFAHDELTDLSKASDRNNGSRRNTVKDGYFCNKKQESNTHDRIGLLRSSCPSPGDDFFMTGGTVKSIKKTVQSPQNLILQHSLDPAVSVVGSFHNQNDPDFCSVKAKECLSRSGSGEVYITRDSKSQNHIKEVSKSLSSNFCEQTATYAESDSKKSPVVRPTEVDARRLSSSKKSSKSITEIAMDSAEKENIALVAASRSSRAVTICATEASFKPVSSSNLDGWSLLAKSFNIETAVIEKASDAQANILSGVNPADNIEDRSATTVAKVAGDLVEKDRSCFRSRLTSVRPEVGLDVSVMMLPSDCAMSVMPKQLDFDDVEESSMNGISSADLKEGRQGMSPEEEPLKLLEPGSLLDKETSLLCQGKCNSLEEMHLLETQDALIREEGSQIEYCASHFDEADVARKALNAMSPNKELLVIQKEFCSFTSPLMNHSSTSQVAGENLSGSFSKEVMASKPASLYSKQENDESSMKFADAISEANTGNDMHKYPDETSTNFAVGFPSAALMDEVNVGLTHQAPSSIFLSQNGDLLRQRWLSDGKGTGVSTDFQNFRSSIESFTYDVEHSWPQRKRRKIEFEREKFLPASSNFLEKPLDSTDQRSVRNLSIEGENHETVPEVQHLTSNQEDVIGYRYVSKIPMEEMQDTGECQTMEEFSLKVRKEEKFTVDGRDRGADNILVPEANLSGFRVNSTMRCTMDGKVESWLRQVNCGQESAEHVTCVERSTSSRRIYPGGNAKSSGGSSVSPGIQRLDLIGTDDTVPEFEGFIMQTDNAQPCTTGDQMELEKMNLLSNSIDYTSLGKSRLMHSPSCYSSTPYKLHNIPDLYQSLPNGLLEGMGLRTSLPLNNKSTRSLSDCLPNCQGQYTPLVQTIWDRINSCFGSSGKRQSLKLELPCISEENENVDENAETLQKGIGSEGMATSITREPLAEIIDNANPSTSVVQDDILTDGRVDFVSTEFNFSGTHNKVKKKLDKQDGNGKKNQSRRFNSKGKKKQSISLGENGAKRAAESVCNRSSRPKLSGKDSMRQKGPTYPERTSTRNNIVSNITSFIPLVQQKQAAAAAITGKRDIKVKALEAAEAAKRMAEKKENERKMKKEALKLERERLEQQNLRQLELQKKKKEEERKKKDAEMAAKKRQREEEEKKEKERKRKRVNGVKKQQQEHEKIYAKKEHTEVQCQDTGDEVQGSTKFVDERENHNNLQLQDNREGNVEKISATEPLNIRDSTKESCLEYAEPVNTCPYNGKVMGNFIKLTEDDDFITKNALQEQSYEISPYKGSDDEYEDDDDRPNNKFIPSWASRHRLSLATSSQTMYPERTVFVPRFSCDLSEVLTSF